MAEPLTPSTAKPLALSRWIWAVAGLVFVMVVVGGATRLTQSGLSMVRWEPISGIIPPLSASDWNAEFDAYRATPEYLLVNTGMSLSQFKGIFWWEYIHRVLGRLIGVALVVPLLWFLYRRAVPNGYGKRLTLLAALVGLQGAIGWWMVASGLVDRPDVAHERLALHLITALVLLAALVWTALDLQSLHRGDDRSEWRPGWLMVSFMLLLFVQLTLGAFTAGLNAGFVFNTWPKMNGAWVPSGLGDLSPWWSNAVDNLVAVQFLHRWMAVVVAAVSLAVAYRLYRSGQTKLALMLELVVASQFLLGVLTLINAVPVGLGVAHQGVGALLLVAAVVTTHQSGVTDPNPDVLPQHRPAAQRLLPNR